MRLPLNLYGRGYIIFEGGTAQNGGGGAYRVVVVVLVEWGGGGGKIGGTQHRRPRENPRATLEFTSLSLRHRRSGLPLCLPRGPPIQATINSVESHPKMVNSWGSQVFLACTCLFENVFFKTYKRTKPALRLKIEYFLRCPTEGFKIFQIRQKDYTFPESSASSIDSADVIYHGAGFPFQSVSYIFMPRPLQRHGHRPNPQDEADFHLDSLYRQAFCYVAKPEGTPVTFCGAPKLLVQADETAQRTGDWLQLECRLG
jgi:hypothetical protein